MTCAWLRVQDDGDGRKVRHIIIIIISGRCAHVNPISTPNVASFCDWCCASVSVYHFVWQIFMRVVREGFNHDHDQQVCATRCDKVFCQFFRCHIVTILILRRGGSVPCSSLRVHTYNYVVTLHRDVIVYDYTCPNVHIFGKLDEMQAAQWCSAVRIACWPFRMANLESR